MFGSLIVIPFGLDDVARLGDQAWLSIVFLSTNAQMQGEVQQTLEKERMNFV